MNWHQTAHRLLSSLVTLALLVFQPWSIVPALAQSAAAARPLDKAMTNTLLAAGDELWGSRFALGVNDLVFAIAANSTDIFVAGDFSSAGSVPAAGVARYNLAAQQWYPLGAGVNNRVYALALFGNHLYVGGSFTAAGGLAIKYLAQYDLSANAWSAVGGSAFTQSVVSPTVRALKVDNTGNLYVGGTFQTVGGVNALNIAKWNGSAWAGLGAGLGASGSKALALAVSGGDVYAGGDFSSPFSGVAHWNGSSWSGLGSGTIHSTYKTVSAIAVSGSNVTIGGDFDTVTGASDVSASHVALWNGSSWAALGSGLDTSVYAMDVDSAGNLYAGGQFTKSGVTSLTRIAKWNGSAWSSMPPGFLNAGADSNVNAVLVSGSEVYAGGAFLTIGGNSANRIARYDIPAQTWYGVGASISGRANAIAVNGKEVYVGGAFTSAGGLAAPGIARWDSSANSWSGLGTGLGGCSLPFCFGPSVFAIQILGSDVYVGGDFNTAGGVSAANIARYNTVDQQWYALGSGITCQGQACMGITIVNALTTDGACIYVGGSFDTAGGVSAANLAEYCPGSGWGSVTWRDENGTYNINPNGMVAALAVDAYGDLYVGGTFTSPAVNIFNTDGYGIYGMGDPLNGGVSSIALMGNDTYIGGSFTNVGGNPAASNIAVLSANNLHWNALGNGLNGGVYRLAVQNNRLAAGGAFTASGGLGLARVGLWDGSQWQPLGSGADNIVNALAADANFIYAGGSFQNAGGKTSTNFGRWGAYHTFLPKVTR